MYGVRMELVRMCGAARRLHIFHIGCEYAKHTIWRAMKNRKIDRATRTTRTTAANFFSSIATPFLNYNNKIIITNLASFN